MSFVDLFRPKWKHSDAAVRADAVRAMGVADESLLVRIAREDGDERVREIAVKKIESPEVLLGLASAGLEGTLAELALQRAGSILVTAAVGEDDAEAAAEALERIEDSPSLAEVAKRAPLEAIRVRALERLEDDRLLADVARGAKRDEQRLVAVGRIADANVLRGLALEGGKREVALAALAKIDGVDLLADIAKHAKIKGVRTRASRRLAELGPATKPEDRAPSEEVRAVARTKREEARRATKASSLCEAVEALGKRPDDLDAPRKLAELREGWTELVASGPLAEGLEARFAEAVAGLEAAIAEAEVARVADSARSAERLAATEARVAILERVEALGQDEPEAALAALEEEWSWLEAAEGEDVVSLERRFTAAAARWRGLREASLRRVAGRPVFEEIAIAAEAAAVVEDLREAKKALAAVRLRYREEADRVPADADLVERMRAAEGRLREREGELRKAREKERQAAFEELEGLLFRLESAGELKDLRDADPLLRAARSARRSAVRLAGRRAWQTIEARFLEAESVLAARVAELREADEWNRHFNVRKQEELCERVEALAGVEDLAEILRELRAAQAEWKRVGRGPKARTDELWGRFKTGGDAAYARCEGHLAEQRKEQEASLARKVALCEEAEALVESTDLKATADRLKEMQAEWKAIGPVRRKDSDAVWKRFRAACDQFFARRKAHFKEMDGERKENLKQKLELCERAEALQDSSDWKETAEGLRALQNEWRGAGPVPRKDSDAVWERFRAACDRFFARREAHLDGGRRANLARKNEMCEALEALLDGEIADGDGADVAETVLASWRDWREVGSIPFDEVARTQARLETAVLRAMERWPAAFEGTELEPGTARARREKLVERAEGIAKRLRGKPEAEEEDEEKPLAEKLREAMARNTFREQAVAEDRQQAEEEAVRLRRAWREAAPVPGEPGLELARRFEEALGEAGEEPTPRLEARKTD